MSFPTRVSVTYTKFSLSVTSFAVPYPSGLSAGERIVIAADFRAPGTIGKPAAISFIKSIGGGLAVGGSYYYELICDGTESGNMTFTSSTGTSAIFQVSRWTGTHATEPAAVSTVGSSGDSAALNPPAATAGWGAADNTFIAFGASSAGTMSFTAAPTNYGSLSSDFASTGGSICNMAMATRNYNSATDDPGTFTTSTNRFWSCMTVILRPAGGGGTTGQIKALVAGVFVSKPVKVYNGSSFVTKPLKYWDGTNWVTTGY